MKYVIALFAVFAVASAQVYLSAPAWNGLGGVVAAPGVLAAPSVYAARTVVAAPALAAPVAVPAVGAGYVAQTRGSVHTAPLPGHLIGSTHLNVAPAPGTL